MKKAKRRKVQFRPSRRQIAFCSFFCTEGVQSMNAARVELAFKRGEKVLARVVFWDEVRYAIIQWRNSGYFTLSYTRHQRYAHPYTMTLAKYRRMKGKLA